MASPQGGFLVNRTEPLAGYSPLVGMVPNPASAVIYKVPPGKNTAVASIEIYNGSGGPATVTVYIDVDGTPSAFGGTTLATMTGWVDGLPRNFADGTKISAVSDVAGVTYMLQLKEYTP